GPAGLAAPRRSLAGARAMTFRTRLLALFILVIAVAVGLVTAIVSTRAARAFERMDNARTEALVAQFRRQFDARRKDVARRVEGIAAAPSTLQMAIDFSQPNPDYSRYVESAQGLAAAQGLDFLELVANDGSIISSAQWPARFGYKEEWVTNPASDWKQ